VEARTGARGLASGELKHSSIYVETDDVCAGVELLEQDGERPGPAAEVEHALAVAEEQACTRCLQQQPEQLAARGLSVETRLRIGDPATEIVRAAEEVGADAIAMSTHGRTGLDHLVHGSVAEGVLRTSHLPVLIVRPDPAVFAQQRAQGHQQVTLI
jgi:nucleotide-binding universal stress UspA family protein